MDTNYYTAVRRTDGEIGRQKNGQLEGRKLTKGLLSIGLQIILYNVPIVVSCIWIASTSSPSQLMMKYLKISL